MKALFLFAISIFLLQPSLGGAQMAHVAADEKLGEVKFVTSCGGEIEPQFNRAVALMHSFQFGRAIDGFHAILDKDPSCAMAYWGIALSSWGNPFAANAKSAAQLAQGSKAVERAHSAATKTARERGYIEAVSQLYDDPAHRDQRSRMVAYENAMGAVRAAYPEDTEAAIFYALALAAAADPADKSYANQLKAGAILEKLFAQYPNHPGLAHYIIHTYDVPPLAARAAEAARRYSSIAPSTSHALHMPSHTYTRLGEWDASIQANIASAAVARTAAQPAEELHASDYLVYAYLQTGQDEAARHIVDAVDGIFARYDPAMVLNGAAGPAAAYFARAAIPARYCLERRDWAGAAKLEVHSTPSQQADAITYFARGLGSAHAKDAAGARSAVDALARLREELKQKNEMYWANQVEIQRRGVEAWEMYAAGNSDAAAAAMRAVAAEEDKTEKNVVTPGPLAPAREMLAELLLELKRPAEARKEFAAVLEKEPNRFLSLYGAAEASRLAGDRGGERVYLQKLLTVAGHADQPGRAEIVEARKELASQ